MSLYWEYVAWMRNRKEEAASWTVFFKVFRKLWGVKLRFRDGKGSMHAECDVCIGLKRDIKVGRSVSERNGLVQRYMTHIFNQWRDRMVWWAICTLSVEWTIKSLSFGAKAFNLSVGASCLAMIVDGIDQAKFRIPRVTTDGATRTHNQTT